MIGTKLLASVVSKKDKPSELELIYFLFFEHGISLKEFNELPLPYIFSILKTSNYLTELERKEYEKANKRKH